VPETQNVPPDQAVLMTGPPPLIKRIAIGLIVGGLFGLLELFVYPSIRYVVASVLAGGIYFAILGGVGGQMRLSGWRAAVVGGIAGLVVGTLWCLVSGSPLPVIIGSAVGVFSGAFLAALG